MPTTAPSKTTGFSGLHLRLIAALLAATAAAFAVNFSQYSSFTPLAGWIVFAAVFILSTWVVVGRMDAASTQSHATIEVPGRTITHLLVIVVALASLVGVGALLFDDLGNANKMADAAVAFVAVVASWFTLHTLYTLRYAYEYYSGPPTSIDFHQKEPPQYTDFAYIAFTVGMSFAISDTDVGSSQIRRTALGHALLSYMFGTVILAALINLVAGL